MKILICLASPKPALQRHFGIGKDAIVPIDATCRGFFANHPVQLNIAAWTPTNPPSNAELEKFLLMRLAALDACILLADEEWQIFTTNVRDAVFVVPFDGNATGNSLRNFFHQVLARTLRTFGQLLARFEKGDDGKLLTLPLRNFQAASLREISRLCRDDYALPNFGDRLEQNLVDLRRRVRPRRKSQYKTTYVVDDKSRFFAYGLERHAQFETGGNHHPFCQLNGVFRFGRRIDGRRHYNVSETEGDRTSISGEFLDCHNHVHPVKGRTHLNMFTNDYF